MARIAVLLWGMLALACLGLSLLGWVSWWLSVPLAGNLVLLGLMPLDMKGDF